MLRNPSRGTEPSMICKLCSISPPTSKNQQYPKDGLVQTEKGEIDSSSLHPLNTRRSMTKSNRHGQIRLLCSSTQITSASPRRKEGLLCFFLCRYALSVPRCRWSGGGGRWQASEHVACSGDICTVFPTTNFDFGRPRPPRAPHQWSAQPLLDAKQRRR